MTEKEIHMPLQGFAVHEIPLPVFNNFLFLRRILIGMLRVISGKVRGIHFILRAVRQRGNAFHRVDLVEEQPVFHFIFRMAEHGLAFRFEQHHIDGLYQCVLAFILTVIFRGKDHKIPHTDAISVFQNLPVVIAHVVADHVDDTGDTACRSPHPQHVVITPLYVHGVMHHQPVHDFMGIGTAVINVAYDMQMIHRQAFNQIGQRINEGAETAGFPNRIQNLGMVHRPVLVFIRQRMQQFVQHITEAFRHSLTHLGPGVLGRQQAGQPQQAAQGHFRPGFRYRIIFIHHVQFFFGVINQGTEVFAVPVIHGFGEQHVHFFPDDAGAIV